MERLKSILRNLMMGRNGPDELGRDIGIISIVLYLLALIGKNLFLYILFMCGMFYSIFRMLSSDVGKRQQENWKYRRKLEMLSFRLGQHKTYCIFKCKGCGRKIRVPRGKGKVEVTCPLCGKKVIRRT